MKHAVVLLSGGVDSSTTLAIAIAGGFETYALSFDYGQRHNLELEAACRVAKSLGAKKRSEKEIAHGIPNTYVPARNTIFLSFALAWAEVLGAGHIFLGANAIDYSGYPDCRPEFIALFETLANTGTKAGVEGARFRIHAPLIQCSKADIIRKARQLDVDLALTHSCYDPSPQGLACGLCDACQFRLKGFREAGFTDPIRYASR